MCKEELLSSEGSSINCRLFINHIFKCHSSVIKMLIRHNNKKMTIEVDRRRVQCFSRKVGLCFVKCYVFKFYLVSLNARKSAFIFYLGLPDTLPLAMIWLFFSYDTYFYDIVLCSCSFPKEEFQMYLINFLLICFYLLI